MPRHIARHEIRHLIRRFMVFAVLLLCSAMFYLLDYKTNLGNALDYNTSNEQLYMSEVFYNPLGSDYCCEFLEIYTNQSLNLTDYVVGDLSSNDTLQLLKWSNSTVSLIIPFGFSYANLSELECNVYSVDSRIGNGLNNNGDVIYFYDRNNSMILNFSYMDYVNVVPEGYSLQLMIDNGLWIATTPTPCELVNYTKFFDIGLISNISINNVSINISPVLNALNNSLNNTLNNSELNATITINTSLFNIDANSIINFSQASVNISVYYNVSLVVSVINTNNSNDTNSNCSFGFFNSFNGSQDFPIAKDFIINSSSSHYSRTIQDLFSMNITNITINNSFPINSSCDNEQLNVTILVNSCGIVEINNYASDNNSLNNYDCGLLNTSFVINISQWLGGDSQNDSNNFNNSYNQSLNNYCNNASISLLLNKNLLVLGESLKFKPIIWSYNQANNNSNNSYDNYSDYSIDDCNFTIQYWVQDLKGNIVKSKRNTTNQDWKSFTASESTINGFERAFLVIAELIFNHHVIKTNSSLSVFYNPDYEGIDEYQENQTIQSNISLNPTLTEDALKIGFKAYKGDTTKRLVSLSISGGDEKIINFKDYLNKKFSGIEQVMEIPLKQISCIRYFNISLNGLGLITTKTLNNSYYHNKCKQGSIKALKIVQFIDKAKVEKAHTKNLFNALATIDYEYENLIQPVLEFKVYKLLKTKRLIDKRFIELPVKTVDDNSSYDNDNIHKFAGSVDIRFNLSEGIYKIKVSLSDESGKDIDALEQVINISSIESNSGLGFKSGQGLSSSSYQNTENKLGEKNNKILGFATTSTILDIPSKNKKAFIIITGFLSLIALMAITKQAWKHAKRKI